MKHDSIKKDGGPHECFTWAKPLIPRILWFPTICPVTHDQKRSEEMDLDVSEFRGPIFIFIFLYFVFYKNIFSFSKFTGICPAARPLGRAENLCADPWRTGRPAEGRPAPRPSGSEAAGPGRPPAG